MNDKQHTPDFQLFEGKSFSDLMKDIYDKSNEKKQQIEKIIEILAPMIRSVNSAEVLAPIIKEYLDVGVKNDEQLVKLASVIQRHVATFSKPKGGGDDGLGLTEQEKKQLLESVLDDELKNLAKSN